MLDQQPQIALEPLAPAAALTEELAAQSAAQAGRCAAQLLLLRAAAGPAAAAVLGRPPASPALLPAQAPHCFAPLLHAPKAPAQSHAKPKGQAALLLLCTPKGHADQTSPKPAQEHKQKEKQREDQGRQRNESNQKPRGHEEPPFPINSWNKISQIHLKFLTLEKKRGEERK